MSGQFALGDIIGLLSGLVGAGGAFIASPFMGRCNVSMRPVVATYAALGLPVAQLEQRVVPVLSCLAFYTVNRALTARCLRRPGSTQPASKRMLASVR